jgi:HEAT repeat protein
LALALIAPLATIGILGMQDRGAAVHLDIPTVKQLVEDLRDSGDPLTRRRAAWWLGEHEALEAVTPLTDALRDPSTEVRLTATWALGEIKDDNSIPSLIRSLEDDDMLVREMAVLALGEIENPSAVEPLVKMFGQEDLRAAVVWALGEIRGEKALEARRQLFTEWGRTPWKNDQVWTGVLGKRLPESDDVETVLHDLRRGDVEERRLASLTLGHLGIRHRLVSSQAVEEAVDSLLDALHDPEPAVRAAAVWALDEINPSRTAKKTILGGFHRLVERLHDLFESA